MKTTPPHSYDIIGDIHGHADTLEALLQKLGYQNRDGVYRHSDRKVIFAGDFVDRGPKIRETLHLVRRMVDGGAAHAVMGNHELNAIFYHSQGADGQPIRPHSKKNRLQHEATLKQLAEPHPEEWADWLHWFKGLPFHLDLGQLRVVHAAWCRKSLDLVGRASLRDRDFLLKAGTHGTPEFVAVEVLLKGVEIPLPDGFYCEDKEGIRRKKIRVRWFGDLNHGRIPTYYEMSLPASDTVPEMAVPAEIMAEVPCYAETEAPVIFGHYWLTASHPACQAINAACVDFSVAKAGGRLAAYRWDGEQRLDQGKVVMVERVE